MPSPKKLISLENLAAYTEHVEKVTTPMTYEQYQALPESEKNSGKNFYITNLNVAPTALNTLIFSLRGTLNAGETTITFSDPRITATSLFSFFYPNTEKGAEYTEFVRLSSSSFSLSFTAQAEDLDIAVLVFNV